MASFAKATKWLLDGHKIKPTEWRKGTYMRFDDRGELVDHAGMVIPITRNLAILDYVRLVPRKRVDESLYEPVGTMPQVGDSCFDLGLCVGREDNVTFWRDPKGPTSGADDSDFNGPDAFRILKRPERNVFTDPRVGDVVARDGIQRTVLAVHERGVLALGGGGEVLGYSLSTWAALESYGTTVKHRAEGGAK